MMMRHVIFGRFQLGQVVATHGVMDATTEDERISALTRHCGGDWGEVCADDKAANDEALASGGRLLSAYLTASGTKFWVITEHDRSVTTLLLPSEY